MLVQLRQLGCNPPTETYSSLAEYRCGWRKPIALRKSHTFAVPHLRGNPHHARPRRQRSKYSPMETAKSLLRPIS